MSTLGKVVELTGTAGDYYQLDVGAETYTGAFTLCFWSKTGDRDYANQPAPAAGEGVWLAHAQAGGSQIGWQIDIGAEAGACRFVLVNNVDAVQVARFTMPPPGWTHVGLVWDYNGGNPILSVYYNAILQFVENSMSGLATAGLGSSGLTAISFGSRAGTAEPSQATFGGYCRYWASALSATEIANDFNNGRPQDYASSTVTAPDSLTLWGNGPTDTATTFEDQTANNNDMTRVGTTDYLTNWDPCRLVGVWKTFTGNDTAEFTVGQSGGVSQNLSTASVTSPSNAVRLSGAPPSGDEFNNYCRLNESEYAHRQFVYGRFRCRNTSQVIGIGCVPFRQGLGVEAQALACAINIGFGISTIHTGEYNTSFGTSRIQSNSPPGAGTSPISGGGDTMGGTPAIDDIYALCYQLDGHTITFWCWNETQNAAPVRVQYQVDNESDGTLTDLMPQSGYPAVFKLLTGDVDILEIRHFDLTTYQPEVAIVCDSLMDVDQDLYTDTVVGQYNEFFEASGDSDRWVVHIGRPGDRIEDAQQILDDGHATRVAAKDVVLEVCVNTLGSTSLATTSTELSALLADYRAISTTELIVVPYVLPGTWGSTIAPDWNDEADIIVSTDNNAYTVDTWTPMGDPTGTNNKNAALLDPDLTHMNNAGASTYEGALSSGVDALTYVPPVVSGGGISEYISGTIDETISQAIAG